MKFFFKSIFIITFCWGFLISNAQNFNNLNYGTEFTLDVISWNIKWFPTNGQTSVNYVKEIITALDAEIYAIQEIDNKSQFQNLIDDLSDYDGYYIPNDSYQSLGYLYKKSAVQIADSYEIFTDDWSSFPRSPLILEILFENEKYILINNHLKCCGDGAMNIYDSDDEETRRYTACNKLYLYIENNFDNEKLILLGDLNDELTDREQDNVFKKFLNDDNYLFADMDIAEGSQANWSYPTWPSHLDHILISNELFAPFDESASSCETIRLDDYFSSWNAYENNVSDHRPVGIKIQTKEVGVNTLFDDDLISVYPNPFVDEITISTLQKTNSMRIYDIDGVLLYEDNKPEIKTILNTKNWAAGFYLIKLSTDQNSTTKAIIKY